MERSPDKPSEKERKEKDACLRVLESAKEIFKEAERQAEAEKNFSPADKGSTKRYPVDSAFDYMVAVAQRERQEGESLLESTREKGDYYEEKMMSKLKVFLRKEETFLRALAEMESQFPEIASFLKTQKPYLQDKISNMEKKWQR